VQSHTRQIFKFVVLFFQIQYVADFVASTREGLILIDFRPMKNTWKEKGLTLVCDGCFDSLRTYKLHDDDQN